MPYLSRRLDQSYARRWFGIAVVLLIALFASDQGAAVSASCNGVPATIVGTAGQDRILGTNARDVVYGGSGNDTISGLNGDDLLCGGPGNDLLDGGNDNDLLDGTFGDDRLLGDNGNDKLFGGPGDDVIVADNGDDLANAGPGSDNVQGGRGDDLLVGGADADSLAGDQGTDTCSEGETLSSCELAGGLAPVPTVDLTNPVDGDVVSNGEVATVLVGAAAFPAIVELFLGGESVGSVVVSAPGSYDLSFDLLGIASGHYGVSAVVRDAQGAIGLDSDTRLTIDAADSDFAEGPTSGLVFGSPIPLGELEQLLSATDLVTVEFSHSRASDATSVPSPTPGFLALINDDGGQFEFAADEITGGFSAPSGSAASQAEEYRAAYATRVPGGEPQVTALRVRGTQTSGSLGALADRVVRIEAVQPGGAFSGAGLSSDSRGGPSLPFASLASSLAIVPPPPPRGPWWPNYGQMNTLRYSRTFTAPLSCIPVPCVGGQSAWTVRQKRAIFGHIAVFSRTSLSNFAYADGTPRFAYEHDVKLVTPAATGEERSPSAWGRSASTRSEASSGNHHSPGALTPTWTPM